MRSKSLSNKSIDFVTKSQRIKNFDLARKLALQLDPGRVKRAKAAITGIAPSTYTACKDISGMTLVIGDTMDDIPKPTRFINGRPAIQVDLFTKLIL